jgi:hypothetical protein
VTQTCVQLGDRGGEAFGEDFSARDDDLEMFLVASTLDAREQDRLHSLTLYDVLRL